MKVYRPTFKDKLTGKTEFCGHWYLTFVDNLQIRRRLPAFTDKRATERAAEKVEQLLSSGGVLTQELQHWLEKEIPANMRQRLVDYGVIDSQRMSSHLGKSLNEHVADFAMALAAKGNGPRYCEQIKSRLVFIFASCGFKAWTDLDANRLYTYLAGLRGDDGIGQRTFNAYLKAAKQFCRWMVRERRATSNPLEHLGCVTQTEKRVQRRALELDDQRKLLTVTAAGPTHHNLTGHERVMVYRLALETGLRANEIRLLTVAAFDFKTCTLTLPGSYTKNKRKAELDLKAATAAEFKTLLGCKLPDVQAFAMPDQPSKMIQIDLAAAGIPYDTPDGRADFHSLRHSFITGLARAGVHPSDAQALARHSTITLTMDYYTHRLRSSLKQTINAQPDLTIAPKSLSSACPEARPA